MWKHVRNKATKNDIVSHHFDLIQASHYVLLAIGLLTFCVPQNEKQV